ncbi:alpha/beta hydrolase [Paraburkholderia unamae]|uniref:Alpha/beta hydrolase n=1 Tax=Paraburkholderia unamae TaxID=219649 RepID=A0ACC6RKS8_9BURK
MSRRLTLVRVLGMLYTAVVSSMALAQVPPDFDEKLRALGRVIDPAATAALYAPLLKTQDYSEVHVTRDLSYGPAANQRLDLFVPAAAARSPRPVLIFVHGGGFVAGDKHSSGSPFYDNVMLWATNRGLIGVNLNHRMAPQNTWPAGAEDVGLAVRWVQENIASHGGDPHQVFLVGHSSGAALAASYVAQPRFYGPAGAGLAGVIFLSTNIFDPATADASPALKAYFGNDAAQYAERSSLPGLLQTPLPLMVTTAELDPVSFENQALQLRDALCKENRCPTFVRFSGYNHMSEVYSINSTDDTVGAAILAFVRASR